MRIRVLLAWVLVPLPASAPLVCGRSDAAQSGGCLGDMLSPQAFPGTLQQQLLEPMLTLLDQFTL